MLTGMLRITVKKLFKNRTLILKTPTAVAGVRGTDFGVITSQTETKIVVFDGKVDVANKKRKITKSYTLKKGEESMGLVFGDVKIIPPKDESWVTADDQEGNIAELIYFISRAKKEIKVVCGEMDPSLYDHPDVVNELYNFLKEDKNRKIEFVFSKTSISLKEACRSLYYGHENLFRKLDELEDWSRQVIFYWTHIRPNQHYTIIDDDASAIEEPFHKKNHRRFIKYFYNNIEINSFLKKYFTEYTDIIKSKKNVCNEELKKIWKQPK